MKERVKAWFIVLAVIPLAVAFYLEVSCVSTDYKIDCIGCHTPAEHTDWVYTQGYPTLHEPEKKGSKSGGASE